MLCTSKGILPRHALGPLSPILSARAEPQCRPAPQARESHLELRSFACGVTLRIFRPLNIKLVPPVLYNFVFEAMMQSDAVCCTSTSRDNLTIWPNDDHNAA